MDESSLIKVAEKLMNSLISKKNEDLINTIKVKSAHKEENGFTVWDIHIFLTKKGTRECYEKANKWYNLQKKSLPIPVFIETISKFEQHANQIFQPMLTKQISDVLKYVIPGEFTNSFFTTFHFDKNFNL